MGQKPIGGISWDQKLEGAGIIYLVKFMDFLESEILQPEMAQSVWNSQNQHWDKLSFL